MKEKNHLYQNYYNQKLSLYYTSHELYQISSNTLQISRSNIKNILIRNLTRSHKQSNNIQNQQTISQKYKNSTDLSKIHTIYAKQSKIEQRFQKKKKKINQRFNRCLQIIGQDQEIIDRDLKILRLCKKKVKKEPPTQAKQK